VLSTGLGDGANGLKTPHKLRPEARSRNRPGHRRVVSGLRKPMAEAVTLHAAVRPRHAKVAERPGRDHL
jgi:hypothetical protein